MLSARKLISEAKIQEFSAEQGFKVEKEDLEEISEKKKYFYAGILEGVPGSGFRICYSNFPSPQRPKGL